MSNVLTDEEVERLIVLGRGIKAGLECDANGTGFPCRTDRLMSVMQMKEYLTIHGIQVIDEREE